jgi:hypothetical protein
LSLQVVTVSAGFAVVNNDHGSLEYHDGGIEVEMREWLGTEKV